MKRSGFTLMELVFVIVVLGILAAVAIPRLSGVQDDALATTEDAGIGAVRTGVQGIRGKIILAQGKEFNITVTGSNGIIGYATVTPTGANKNVVDGNLRDLSVNGEIQNGSNTLTQDAENKDGTLCAVLEPGSREKWKTKKDTNNTNNTRIAGPATSTITDLNAKYNTGGSWLYQPSAGTVIYLKSTPY